MEGVATMRMGSVCVAVLIGSGLLVLLACGGGGGAPDPEGGDGGDEPPVCGDCHGVPPDTGAHLAHYGEQVLPPRTAYGDLRIAADLEPSGSTVYLYGCGNCHPTDPALHDDGTVQVELYSATAPTDSLKALHPASAAFDGAGCSNVYCHSTGQETPSYVATPAWDGGSLPLPRCAACHQNPPSYPSGGAGTATANGHLLLDDTGYEFGHFAGLPGPSHGTFHGGRVDPLESAAPITCQTCHYESVDPTNTGPGGFYYLDTTGSYDLGGSLGFACDACHDGAPSSPAQGTGRAWPLRHVDGGRDVVFDPRTSIPAGVTGLPAPPDRPTRPYWLTSAPSDEPPDSGSDGAVWSLHLAGSGYDPTTKTCSSVPCHLRQSFGTGMPAHEPLTWGLTPVGWGTCEACHQF